MELPTCNRKKLLTFDWRVLSQKTTLFSFFGRSYLGNRSTYISENVHRILFRHYLQVCLISLKSKGGLAKLAKIGWSDTEWPYRPLSRRLDRCDRVIQKESGDPNDGNMCSFSWATGTSRVRHNADCVPCAQIRFDLWTGSTSESRQPHHRLQMAYSR